MSDKYVLKCISCGREFENDSGKLSCPDCKAALDVIYDYEALRNQFRNVVPHDPKQIGVWRYAPILPISSETKIVTLGEGINSPLTKAENLSKELGIQDLYVKDETHNPTSSFKDRKSTLMVTKALEEGYKAVACETAGNAGTSVAAYARKANMDAYVFVSEGISDSKLAKLSSYEPSVFMTRGPSSDIFNFLLDFCAKFGILNATAASRYNPYVKEGGKTAVFQIYEQLRGKLPDWIILPLGGGGNLSSYFKGLRELRSLGLCEEFPKLVGVQGKYCAPLVEAFEKNLPPDQIPHVKDAHTIAHSILDDWPPDGDQAINAIRFTKGSAVGVTDEEILGASKLLSSRECIFAEPASVAPLAALKKLVASGKISRGESVVLVATGHGLNQPEAAIRAWGRPPEVKLSIDAMREYVKTY